MAPSRTRHRDSERKRSRGGVRPAVGWCLTCLVTPGCALALSDNFYIENNVSDAGAQPRANATGGSSGATTLGGSSAIALGGVADLGGTSAPEQGGTSGSSPLSSVQTETGGDSSIGSSASTTVEPAQGGALATGGAGATGAALASGGTGEVAGESATGGSAGGGFWGHPGGATAAGGTIEQGGTGFDTGATYAVGGWWSGRSGGADAGGNTAAVTGSTSYSPCADSVAEGDACTSYGAPCYRTCGPSGLGTKSLACRGGTYVESSCSFPDAADYSCYKIPASVPSACPYPTIPQATLSCAVPTCTVCFGGSTAAPTYKDSTGTTKNGYCVCTSDGVWTCASSPAWPCPGNTGC